MSDFSFPSSTAVPFVMPNAPQGVVIDKVFLGNGLGTDRFGVAVAHSNSTPSLTDLRTIHAARVGKTGAKIVVAVVTGDRCVLFGPGADAQPFTLKTNLAKVFLGAVLDEPDLLSAYRRFSTTKRAVEVSETPWFTNHGLFASYHIRENAPKSKDWDKLNQAYLPLIKKRGAALINSLGFTSTKNEDQVLILSSTTDSSVVAILLQDDETFEGKSNRFQSSPVTWALKVAADRQIPWVVALKKGSIRLYPAKDGVGVGQRGQVETFFELDLELLDATNAGYLGLVFSELALRAGGSADSLISDSAKYSTSLGDRLRDRIYLDVVPDLAKAVAAALIPEEADKSPESLEQAYSVSLRILFRLLFQAYAEDRGLLPAGRNAIYDDFSLKALAKSSGTDSNSYDLWKKLSRVWNAVENGDKDFQVPAYKGGLFDTDKVRSPEGYLITQFQLSDNYLHKVIKNLVIDSTEDDISGAVDFRSLSVREFGTIYEGLLESSISVAAQNLTVDDKNSWVPAKTEDTVIVSEGEVYLHSSSGERKSTGSYYTPSSLVDWLISRSLTPALQRHLDKVQSLIDADELAEAGKIFFDFRVADIAMGSGHFLVAAVDRIEAMMRSFLADQKVSLARVENELRTLESDAKEALAEDYASFDAIDSSSLLRRQIARRCVYGLDLNPLAVELSRLAIWIHTFVPGLPMSSLDHSLVCGNSLTGIGSIEEALALLQPEIDPDSTFYEQTEIETTLGEAGDLYRKIAENSESTSAKLIENSKTIEQAKNLVLPVKDAFDAALAIRLKLTDRRSAETSDQIASILSNPNTKRGLFDLRPAHFPHLFPEVFSRARPGFDVLIGNPPWEKMVVKPLEWWFRFVPGIKSSSYPKATRERWLKEFQQENPGLMAQYENDVSWTKLAKEAIATNPFEGMGSADLDLYVAFSWRNWQLLRDNGQCGLVLPRNAFMGSALEMWRRKILSEGQVSDLAIIANRKKWAFPIDPRVSVGLLSGIKSHSDTLTIGGPFQSESELNDYDQRKVSIESSKILQWSSSASIVLVESQEIVDLFNKIYLHPKSIEAHTDFSYRAYSDFHATSDRPLFEVGEEKQQGEIPVLTGGSFSFWEPDFGPPYGHAKPKELRAAMAARLSRSSRLKKSPFYEESFGEGNLPWDSPRIAFRAITNRTNTRTCVVCLIPPGSATVNMATVLLRKKGTPVTDAFMLGIMSSVIYDWVARRWIEGTFSINIFEELPIPTAAFNTQIGRGIVELAARLAAKDARFETWANECGVKVSSVKSAEEKNELISELDALVAIAYGLSAKDVSLIMETFHVGWDYQSHLEKVLGYFEKWSN
jgi:hypothetical protein